MILTFLESMIGTVPEGLEIITYVFAMFWLLWITKLIFSVFAIFTGQRPSGMKY